MTNHLDQYLTIFILILIGYLIGSIPFGYLVIKIVSKKDIRKSGSGNFGATNVLRVEGKYLAAVTLLLDAGKSVLAFYIGLIQYQNETTIAVITGVAAVIGHIFPVWLKFNGGKGIASYLGLLSAFHWPIFVICIILWLTMFAITGYSSIAAISIITIIPFYFIIHSNYTTALISLALAIVIAIKHKSNLNRLWHGKELKIHPGIFARKNKNKKNKGNK